VCCGVNVVWFCLCGIEHEMFSLLGGFVWCLAWHVMA